MEVVYQFPLWNVSISFGNNGIFQNERFGFVAVLFCLVDRALTTLSYEQLGWYGRYRTGTGICTRTRHGGRGICGSRSWQVRATECGLRASSRREEKGTQLHLPNMCDAQSFWTELGLVLSGDDRYNYTKLAVSKHYVCASFVRRQNVP